MKLTFKYEKEKDIWCLLTKGKSSDNLDSSTEVYKELVAQYGDSPTEAETSMFIDEYIKERNISFDVYIARYEKEWENITDEFQKKAESIFGVALSQDITVYFTINNLCPYNVVDNYFFIKTTKSPTAIIIHELWHFYTWYSFGADQKKKLGKQTYNALIGKEILIDYATITGADDIWSMKCNCGSTKCRGKIVPFKRLPKELRDAYKKQGIVPAHILAI